jgi:diphthamide biosynthesis protein 4
LPENVTSLGKKSMLYDLLGADADASYEELKQQFRVKALEHHPDKNRGDTNAAAKFAAINEAWEVLGDQKDRAVYDASLGGSSASVRVSDEIDLDDMAFDERTESYAWKCRCGDAYTISVDELEDGCDVIGCGGCSLNIRVLYEEGDEEGEQGEEGGGEEKAKQGMDKAPANSSETNDIGTVFEGLSLSS